MPRSTRLAAGDVQEEEVVVALEAAKRVNRVNRGAKKSYSSVLLTKSLVQELSRASPDAPSRVFPWRNVARETAPPAVRSGRRQTNHNNFFILIFTNTTHFTQMLALSSTVSEFSPRQGARKDIHDMG